MKRPFDVRQICAITCGFLRRVNRFQRQEVVEVGVVFCSGRPVYHWLVDSLVSVISILWCHESVQSRVPNWQHDALVRLTASLLLQVLLRYRDGPWGNFLFPAFGLGKDVHGAILVQLFVYRTLYSSCFFQVFSQTLAIISNEKEARLGAFFKQVSLAVSVAVAIYISPLHSGRTSA